MKTVKPWIHKNGQPLSDAELKLVSRVWDRETWNAYLNWYQSPLAEFHLHPEAYDRICESRWETIFEEFGHQSSDFARRVCERLLKTLPAIEAQVIRLYFFDGLTDSEIAAKIQKSRSRTTEIKNNGISRLKRGIHGETPTSIQYIEGFDSESANDEPTLWDRPLPFQIRENRKYEPGNWKEELASLRIFSLRLAVHSLSPTQQQIVYLRFWCDFPIARIARAIGISASSVDQICDAAVFKIKSQFIQEELLQEAEGGSSCA